MSDSDQPASWIDEEIACEAAFARSGAPHDWPDDEPATVTRMAASMAAECVRLREEVKRLRLTDAERKLLQRLETSGALDGFMLSDKNRQTLRNLLARVSTLI